MNTLMSSHFIIRSEP